MAKKRSFSIFLLKEGMTVAEALDPESNVTETEAHNLPSQGVLYTLQRPNISPWWRGYLAVPDPLSQTSAAGILFFPAGSRWFAITFGIAAQAMLDTAYEHDFGTLVSLNSLDPSKIKNTDTFNPAFAIRQRTQVAGEAPVAEFAFDRGTNVVRSITGKVREQYAETFSAATGSAQLRVSSDRPPQDLPELCKEFLNIYNSEDWKQHFPDFRNITPVRDPLLINQLNESLIKNIDNYEVVDLGIPDIIDYRDGLFVKFTGARGKRPNIISDFFIGDYIDYLEERDIKISSINIEMLKKHKIVPCDENGQKKSSGYSIFKALTAEISLGEADKEYHLAEGAWYEVDKSFLNSVTRSLDSHWSAQTLPDFTEKHSSEGEYNADVGASEDSLISLDTKNIAPTGQSAVEPCDLVNINAQPMDLIHVKRSTRSSQLSHLFFQGLSATILMHEVPEARKKFQALLSDASVDVLDDLRGSSIRYAIITKKDGGLKSRNLPLFSRISLNQVVQDFTGRNISVAFEFVRDRSINSRN